MNLKCGIVAGLVIGTLGMVAAPALLTVGGESSDEIPAKFRKLVPLHKKLGPPRPDDWLDVHKEPGQTFRQYVRNRPVKVDRTRRTIYLQPLGDFTDTQEEIIQQTAQFMQAYFALPVRVRDALPTTVVPAQARRVHPTRRVEQMLTTHIILEILKPRLPKDAVVMIGLTASDLWPGGDWNYVFGQASLGERVGVWSLYRFGNPDESPQSRQLCLRRTLKLATHETGHMFSMMHCTLYECNMCGTNHLAESDRRPMWLCPHCLAKLCYATDADPDRRFDRLISFCQSHDLKPEQAFYEKSLALLRGK
jgi:archaemetzincin